MWTKQFVMRIMYASLLSCCSMEELEVTIKRMQEEKSKLNFDPVVCTKTIGSYTRYCCFPVDGAWLVKNVRHFGLLEYDCRLVAIVVRELVHWAAIAQYVIVCFVKLCGSYVKLYIDLLICSECTFDIVLKVHNISK